MLCVNRKKCDKKLNVKCLSLDVNIWLVTFGFHLHNAIPGFPIPKFDLTQPSLEMRKSQLWDDLPVFIACLFLFFFHCFCLFLGVK